MSGPCHAVLLIRWHVVTTPTVRNPAAIPAARNKSEPDIEGEAERGWPWEHYP